MLKLNVLTFLSFIGKLRISFIINCILKTSYTIAFDNLLRHQNMIFSTHNLQKLFHGYSSIINKYNLCEIKELNYKVSCGNTIPSNFNTR